MKNKKYLIALFLSLSFLVAKVTLADIIPDGGKKATGDYDLNDALILGVNIANYILGIVGALALAMFVFGGFLFIFSAGSAQTVEKGKNTIIAAVIGLVIVFASWTIVKFSMSALGLEWNGTSATPIQIQTDNTSLTCSTAHPGYSCMDKTTLNMNNYNCIAGLCPNGANIQCCQAK